MRGAAGEFFNVTWPGYVGTLTASAPGRFAAAINQAPLWRRTRKPWLRPYDLAVNALETWPIRFCPPDHLVARGIRDLPRFRRGQAPARDRADRAAGDLHAHRMRARRALRDRAHRGGVSSRTEDTAAANDWLHSTRPWEARVDPDVLLTRSSEEAAARSRARREALVVLAATVRLRRFRLGDAAGAQSLHPHRRGDVRGKRNVAGGRLRAARRASALARPVTQVRELARPSRACRRVSRARFGARRRSAARIFSTRFLPFIRPNSLWSRTGRSGRGTCASCVLRLASIAALAAGATLASARVEAMPIAAPQRRCTPMGLR